MEIIKSLNLMDNVGLTVLILVCSMGFTAFTKVATPLESKYLPFASMIFGIIAGLLVGGFTAGLFNGVKGVTGGYEVKSGEETK